MEEMHTNEAAVTEAMTEPAEIGTESIAESAEQSPAEMNEAAERAETREEPEARSQARKTDPAEEEREAQLRAHFDDMQAQARELKRLFPKFDLQQELKDESFFRWTSPKGGLTLKQAYMALHGDDILEEGMRYAMEQGRQKLAQSIRASQARPREGGLNAAVGITLRADPSALSKADRAELKSRVRRGEKIVF